MFLSATKSAIGGAVGATTRTVLVVESLPLQFSLTSFTSYVPAEANTCAALVTEYVATGESNTVQS